jgi:N-acetylneuraminic acid mutarotase
MKFIVSSIFRFIIIALILVSFSISFSQSWNQTQSFPGTPRDDASYFKIGTKHFIGTGREVGFGCTRDFYFFDENSMSWGNAASLPIGKERQYAAACSWNGSGFLFGGVDCAGIYQNDFWKYDPIIDNWIILSNLPSTGRAGMVQFVMNDTFFIIGGKDSNGILNEVWAYDFVSQSWSQKNNLPMDGIWRGITFQFDNDAFIGLGKNNLNNQTGLNSEILKYDFNVDSWSVVANLNLGTRSYVGHAQTDSLLFLFGGLSETNQILVSTERIHLNDFSVDILADFPSDPRKGGISFIVQNDLYYATGVSTDTRFNETWRLQSVASIDENSLWDIQIYPNPVSSELNIKSNQKIKQIEIYDVLGRICFNQEIYSNSAMLDLNQLQKGNFIIKVKSENQSVYRDLMNKN